MSWTDERVELLKKLWTEGRSASQIANELGSVTRNAVIGKVHRLGLSGRAKSPSSSMPRQRKPRAHSHMMRVRPTMRGNTALAYAHDLEVENEVEMIENVIPIGQRCSLLELSDDKCRWPIGDPERGGLFLLRRQAGRGRALLRLSCARRLSAGGRPPPRPAAHALIGVRAAAG